MAANKPSQREIFRQVIANIGYKLRFVNNGLVIRDKDGIIVFSVVRNYFLRTAHIVSILNKFLKTLNLNEKYLDLEAKYYTLQKKLKKVQKTMKTPNWV